MNEMQGMDPKTEQAPLAAEEKKGGLIKNPLPGPTPHEKRDGLDYDYEVSPDKMHFDIERPTRNYYDIQ